MFKCQIIPISESYKLRIIWKFFHIDQIYYTKTLIWHMMKSYFHNNYKKFIIFCDHIGYIIKKYLNNFPSYNADMTIYVLGKNLKYFKIIIKTGGLQ